MTGAAGPNAEQSLGVLPDDFGHRRGSREFRRIMVALVASGLATFATLYGAQALLPALSVDFGVDPATASLTLSVSTAGLAIGVIPLTAVSDRVGRTRVMTISIVLTALIGLAVPFAPTFAALLAMRAVQGLALAGLQATAMSYLAEELHRGSLGVGVGLYIAGNGVGGMVGRIVAGVLVDVGGWRFALGSVGVVSVVTAVVFAATILPSRRFAPTPLRAGTVIRRAGAALNDRGLLALYTVGFLAMAGFGSVYNYLGYRLISPEFGLSHTVAAALFAVYLLGCVGSTAAGRLVDAYGRNAVFAPAATAILIGIGAMAVSRLAAVAVGLVAITVGFFAVHTVAGSWVGARAGTLGLPGPALYMLAYYPGSAVGGTAGGVVFRDGGWLGLSIYLAALSATVIVLALALRRLRPAAPPPTTVACD